MYNFHKTDKTETSQGQHFLYITVTDTVNNLNQHSVNTGVATK